MKASIRRLLVALALALPWSAFAQGTAFTYQGKLNDGGSPASGSYDLTFTLFATNTGGVILAGPVTNGATIVSNGLFTTLVNLGPGAFTGGSNWLEIAVRTNGASSFRTLTPRQQVTPTPYAIMAENVTGLTNLNAANVTSGTLADARLSSNVALRNANQTFTGQNTFNNGSGVSISGPVSANTMAPASTLTIAGDILMSGGATVYHNFSLTGGNSAGFLYGSYPAFGDGIHLGYNFYADNNGTGHIPNTGGGTSRISVGYGSISLLTGGVNASPFYGLTINSSGNIGINNPNPQATIDLYYDIIYRGNGLWWAGITSGGNFGFGVNSLANQAVAYIDTSGNYHQNSDRRLKRDITSLDNTLDRLLQLRPVSYHFLSASTNAPLCLGLIAQEVQPLFPEVVGEQTNGVTDLVYSELVPVAIRSIQQLNQKLETQLEQRDSEIQVLKQSNDALVKQLNKLQAAVQALQEKR